MISTGAFLNEMDASSKQSSVAEKFAAAWEKKNAKAARAGGVSLMALSLAACGSSSTTTTTATTDTTTTTTTPTVTAVSKAFTVGADALTGTSADDTFTSAYDTSGAAARATVGNSDTLDGGAGNDTVTLNLGGNLTLASGGMTNVETVNIVATGNSTIEFQNAAGTTTRISGVDHIVNLSSTGNVSLTNVSELASVTVNGATGTTTVEFVDTLLAGSADTVTLNLIGADDSTITIGGQTDANGGYETLVVNASGVASDLAAMGDQIGTTSATVTVNASVAMDFGTQARFPKLTTFDASGSTAAVTLTLADDTVTGASTVKTLTGGSGADTFDIDALTEGNVGVVTLTGGAGNDTFDMGNFADTTMVIAGGDGTDTLQFTAALTAAEGATATSIERIFLDGDISQDMSVFSNSTPTIIKVDGDATITRASGDIATIELNDGFDASTSFARTTDPANSSLTLVVKQAVTATGSFTAAEEESITIDSNTAAIDIQTSLIAGDMTSFTAVGDNAVDITVTTSTKVATVDLSGLDAAFTGSFTNSTAAMTITGNSGSNAGIITVTAGSGNDTITGGNAADVITAGAGNDTIAGGNGADNITLGSGSDTVTFAATAAANDMDTINGFGTGATTGGGDVLDFDAFITGGVDQHGGATTAITVYTTASNDDNNITGKLAIFEAASGAVNVVAAEAALILEINGSGDAFSIDNNGKAIVIYGDNGQNDAYAFYIDDSLDGTAGTIGAADVVAVADLLTVNIDNLITTNFDVA